MFQVLEAFEEFEPATLGTQYATESTTGNVKYTDGSKYELMVSNTLFWRRHYPWRGHMVDAGKIFEYYKLKRIRDRALNKDVHSPGAHLEGGTQEQLVHWAKSLIWVLSPRGQFYSHVPKVHRFHHSSLVGGKNVASAGMWIVNEGRLLELAPLSGHYKPNMGQFMNGIVALKEAIAGGRTKLLLWSTRLQNYETLTFEKWTSMTWQELYDDYRVNPAESRPQALVDAGPYYTIPGTNYVDLSTFPTLGAFLGAH